jgi:hypothetical protein
MKNAETIKRIIEQAVVDTHPMQDEKVFEKMTAAYKQTNKAQSEKIEPKIWRIIMKSPITKLAAAAVIIAAVFIGIYKFGGSIDGTSVVWADVVRKIDQVKDYTYRARTIYESSGVIPTGFEFKIKSEFETLWYRSYEFGIRCDDYYNGELSSQYYALSKKQQTVWTFLSEKTYSFRDEQMPSTMNIDPRSYIRQIMAEPYIKLGRKDINGIMAEGIEVQGQKVDGPGLDDAVSRLWVDVETELPVWMEAEGKIHNSNTYARVIQDQFHWNVNLTEADFTPVIPADYTKKDWPVKEINSTEWEKAITARTQQNTKVDFSLLEELGLLGTEEAPATTTKVLTGMEEIYKAQDEVMRSWPSYADMRESLEQELDRRLNLKSRSVEELVQIGVLLREKFWDAGGNFSKVSYRYGYMARVLLEMAYAQRPNDLAIGDELAEAIMAVGTIRKTEGFSKSLLAIRSAQFRQICEEVKAGRKPVWDDFARGCDLVSLSGRKHGSDDGVAVVDWLIQNAKEGGWEACIDMLNWLRPLLAQGHGGGFGIYIPIKPGFPEEFGYGGRPPSFKGPRSRIVVPINVGQSKAEDSNDQGVNNNKPGMFIGIYTGIYRGKTETSTSDANSKELHKEP